MWTVTSPRSKEITNDYEKYSSPAPPQSPKADPSIGQVTPSYGPWHQLLLKLMGSNGTWMDLPLVSLDLLALGPGFLRDHKGVV
jgi:hypothetical protein